MTTMVSSTSLRQNTLGRQVNRATATLPQTAAGALFTVSGGRIILTSILGEVTTAIQNQANNTKIQAVPTTGTAVDLCAVTDVANLEIGGKLSVAGLAATAMIKALAGGIQMGPVAPGIVVAIGSISLNCAASNTGSVKWSITWVPLDDAGTIVAA